MNHAGEEELVLYYYGEAPDGEAIERHLDTCEACRHNYNRLAETLNSVDALPVPDRPAHYGAQVWSALRPSIGRRTSRWMAPLAIAATVLIAFVAGRYSIRPQAPKPALTAIAPADMRERILLVAVGAHLERSRMVLAELVNGGRAERDSAEELIGDNRLYRQTAASVGDNSLAAVLDDLERVLLEIANSDAPVPELRRRVESDGILFKVRVLQSNMKNREEAGSKL